MKYDAPSWLNRDGKTYYRRIAPALRERGILDATTVDLVAMAAHAYSTYREAERHLAEEGRVITTKSGTMKPNPWLTVQKQAFDSLSRVYRQLGVTEDIRPTADDLDSFLDDDE